MKKSLSEITENECRIICEIYGEPFLRFYVNDSKFTGLYVSISTTTTLNYQSHHDSSISIYADGRVSLSRNNGDWNGMRTENISPLPVIDFLKSRGYEFKYELPKKIERKIKLLNIKNI